MTAPLVDHIDHALLRVLGTELRFLATDFSIRRTLRAAWMTAPLVHDTDHALLRVLRAELSLLAAGFAV